MVKIPFKPKPRKPNPNSTPPQRSYGKGLGRGTRSGRVEGAAVGVAAAGFTMAALNNMTLKELKKKAEQAETAAQKARVKAAIEKAMRELAQKDKAKAEMGGTKPKPRPQNKAKGGAVKKMNTGGVSTTKPKKRPGSGLKKTSRSTAKANKIAAMWIKHHKETNTEDFKKASSLLQDYVKQINKKKAKEKK